MGSGKTQPLVVVEDQDTHNETLNAAWEETVKQLADYMIQSREEDTNKQEVTGFLTYGMYSIAHLGRYSRFYVLKSDEDTLRNHAPTGGSKTVHFKDNELEIVGIVKELVSLLWLPLLVVPIIFLIAFVFCRVPSVCQSHRRTWPLLAS